MGISLGPEIRVAASPPLLEKGCVYIISLAQIKERIGERWPRMCEAVWAHLENLLRQKLGPTDFYSRTDETHMLVSLPSHSAQEAQICCLRISNELHEIMLGASDPTTLELERVVALPDGQIGAVPLSAEQIGKLVQLMLRDTTLLAPAVLPDAAILEFRHRFVPVWNAQKQAITTYRCISQLASEPGDPARPAAHLKMELAMAVARIRHGGAVLASRLAQGEPFMLWLSLPYDLVGLANSRMAITAAFRQLSGILRPYLMLGIEALPHGVPQSRLSELVAALRPFCRFVVAQLPPRMANLGAYAGAGLGGVGLSLDTEAAEGEMLSEIFKLGIAARKLGIMSFALDVPSEDLLLAARENGIHLLSSPLIGAARDQPEAVRLLPAESLNRSAA